MLILMSHSRKMTDSPMENWSSRLLVGEGTSKYTFWKEIKVNSINTLKRWTRDEKGSILCCPLLSPQMTGTLLAAPMTRKASVLQTDSLSGWASVKELKSNLSPIQITIYACRYKGGQERDLTELDRQVSSAQRACCPAWRTCCTTI